jgi:hypothetical protein
MSKPPATPKRKPRKPRKPRTPRTPPAASRPSFLERMVKT